MPTGSKAREGRRGSGITDRKTVEHIDELVGLLPLPTLSPEDVARRLGTSPWWVREQARAGRVDHLRLGKGRIRFLPEHVHELIALFTVSATESTAVGSTTPSVPASLAALGATHRSQRAHGTHPVDGP
jgi:hypothetical protein